MPFGGFDYIRYGHSGADYPSQYALKSVTAISSPATNDTFGSWGEIIADTGDRPILIEEIALTGTDSATKMVELEIGTGASSSEATIYKTPTTMSDGTPVYHWHFKVSIWIQPNTRLSARVRTYVAGTPAIVDYGVMFIYRRI